MSRWKCKPCGVILRGRGDKPPAMCPACGVSDESDFERIEEPKIEEPKDEKGSGD
jgi:rubredoxin